MSQPDPPARPELDGDREIRHHVDLDRTWTSRQHPEDGHYGQDVARHGQHGASYRPASHHAYESAGSRPGEPLPAPFHPPAVPAPGPSTNGSASNGSPAAHRSSLQPDTGAPTTARAGATTARGRGKRLTPAHRRGAAHGRLRLLPLDAQRAMRWLALAMLTVALVVTAFSLVVSGLRVVHRGRVLPGVTVGGIEVGGLRRDEVRAALSNVVSARQGDPVVFVDGSREFTFQPGLETYTADLDTAVDTAFTVGRRRRFFTDAWAHIGSLWGRRVDLPLPDQVTVDGMARWVDEVGREIDRQPFPGRVAADPDSLQVLVDPPAPGRQLRRQEAVNAAVAAITSPGPDRLELPVQVVPPRVRSSDVEDVARRAGAAVSTPLTLTAHGTSVALSRSEVARLIGSRVVQGEGDYDGFALEVPRPAVEAVFAPHLAAIDIEPVSARFEVLAPPPVFDNKGDATWTPVPAPIRVVPGATGLRLDPAVAAAQLTALLRDGRHDAELQLVTAQPELTTEQANQLGITQLIGSFTTYHPCCRPRVQNIHRMADLLRGAVVRPGETFSINDHVGRRTPEKGFLADGAIVQGELVEEVGGGVSQVGTTTFNAAFFAGLPVPEHTVHAYYISRYPMGREATLYYPTVDLKFTNDTGHGILIESSYTEESVTISLYGDNGGRVVSAVSGPTSDPHTPPARTRLNPDLAPGSSQVVQDAEEGFDFVYYRIIRQAGRETREEFPVEYDGAPEIVEFGPPLPPPPPPPPAPPPPRPAPPPPEPAPRR